MKKNKIINFCLIIVLMLSLAGCQESKKSIDTESGAELNAAKRFQDIEAREQSAVESAIKLAQEHAALSEEMSRVKQENQKLSTENSQLKERIQIVVPQLEQTKKELEEANNLLVEMRIEMNNWKSDVLSFRDEMRQADKAQLESLLKILEILGGEVKHPKESNSTENP